MGRRAADSLLDLATVTVRDLLDLRQLRHVEVIGGREGLASEVTDVRAASSVRALETSQPGTAFVFDAAALPVESYSVEVALRLARRRGLAALILGEPVRPVPLSTVRLADKLQLPLLTLPIDDALTLATELAAFSKQPEIVRSGTVTEVLRELRRPRATIDEIVEILADGLGCEVGVAGGEGIRVAGRISETAAQLLTRTGHDARWADEDDEAVVALPVSVGGDASSLWLVAYPSSVDPARRQAVLRVLEAGSWALSVYVTEQRLNTERDARSRANLLAEILASRGTIGPDTRERAAVAGWRLDGWHTGVYVLVPNASDPAGVLHATERLDETFAGVGLKCQVVERSDGWSLWTTEGAELPAASYPAFAQSVRDALAGFGSNRSGVRLVAGIGRPFHGAEGIGKSLTEAREAALLAQADPRPVAVLHFDTVGLKRLLVGWYASDVFVEFADGVLKPLRDADPSGELLRTLECYLDSESAVTATAAALGVHRNTVTHRIERICSVLATNLVQPDERLALQLACRVARIPRAGVAAL